MCFMYSFIFYLFVCRETSFISQVCIHIFYLMVIAFCYHWWTFYKRLYSLSFLFQHSFGKQFYRSVSKSDYTTMRLGFIMVRISPNDKLMLSSFLACKQVFFPSLQTHCPGNPKFDFHRYMVRVLEADFKKVVGIR